MTAPRLHVGSLCFISSVLHVVCGHASNGDLWVCIAGQRDVFRVAAGECWSVACLHNEQIAQAHGRAV